MMHKKHIPPSSEPTQKNKENIKWDFNDGARLLLPKNGKTYAYRIENYETGLIIVMGEFCSKNKEEENNLFLTRQKFYIPLKITVWEKTQENEYLEILDEKINLHKKNVLIQMPRGALGDTIAWLPYITAFQKKHECVLTVIIHDHIAQIYREKYPQITFTDPDSDKDQNSFMKNFYASYRVGVFYNDTQNSYQPRNYRNIGLSLNAGTILGFDTYLEPEKPRILNKNRPIPEPYVCIGTQSTMQAKFWNNPTGWLDTISFLKKSGYRIVCIDKNPVTGNTAPEKNPIWNYIPNGCENETGDRTLDERITWLANAAFFIGLSSGLSWLARACRTPTVLISGFTDPKNEFPAEARIWSPIPCNSCWNNQESNFDTKNYTWCPKHENTPRAWECSRLITSYQVIKAITELESYKKTAPTPQEPPHVRPE